MRAAIKYRKVLLWTPHSYETYSMDIKNATDETFRVSRVYFFGSVDHVVNKRMEEMGLGYRKS